MLNDGSTYISRAEIEPNIERGPSPANVDALTGVVDTPPTSLTCAEESPPSLSVAGREPPPTILTAENPPSTVARPTGVEVALCLPDVTDPRSSIQCPVCDVCTVLGKEAVSGLASLKQFCCSQHDSTRLEFYCVTCDELVCSQCCSDGGSHDHHQYDLVESLFPLYKDAIKNMEESLYRQLVRVVSELQTLNVIGVELSNNEGDRTLFDEFQALLHKTLDTKKDMILELLRHDNNMAVSKLKLNQAQLCTTLGFIRESIRMCSAGEILMMESFLTNQVQRLLSQCHPPSPSTRNEEVTLNLTISPKQVLENISELGNVTSADKVDKLSSDVMMTSPQLELERILVKRLGVPILTLSDVNGPCGVAVSRHGDVFVAECLGDCISVFSSNGKKLRSFGECGCGEGELSGPCGVAIDDEDQVYIVDGCNRRVQKFTYDGEYVSCVGGEGGKGDVSFLEPDGIVFNPVSNKIYVVDNNAHQVIILTKELTYFDKFGRDNEGGNGGDFEMHHPWGIACTDAGELYVTDSGDGSCVQVFTSEGRFLRGFGQRGRESGLLQWPTGISVHPGGHIVYVCEYGNKRVSIFSSDGEYLKELSKGIPQGCGELGQLRGVVMSPSGLLYVCSADSNCVLIF